MAQPDVRNKVEPGEASKGGGGHGPPHGPHLVAVTIDGHRKEIEARNYVVSELKTALGVAADYELDEVIKGEFKELKDNAHITIKGGEHFISHVRRGGSS